MDDQGGSERCILHDTNPKQRQAVAPFLLLRSPLPVYLPAIWPIRHSIYQDLEGNHIPAQRAKGEGSGVHKQHSNNGGLTTASEGSYAGASLSTR